MYQRKAFARHENKFSNFRPARMKWREDYVAQTTVGRPGSKLLAHCFVIRRDQGRETATGVKNRPFASVDWQESVLSIGNVSTMPETDAVCNTGLGVQVMCRQLLLLRFCEAGPDRKSVV